MEEVISKELIAFEFDGDKREPEQLQAIDEDIRKINQKLEKLHADADKADYAVAIASGLLTGLIDSFFIGELSITAKDVGLSHEKANYMIEAYAKKRGYQENGKRLKGAIEFLEKKYPVAQDNVWSGRDLGISAKDHHLADLAHHPTPMGLISAIVVQFFRTGTFVDKDGEWHFIPVKTEQKDIIENWLPLIVSGVILWLVNLSEYSQQKDENSDVPEYIWKLARLLASAPATISILKCVNNWIGHLMSDLAGSKQTAGKGMGVPGVFLSLMYEIAAIPGINQTGLSKQLDNLYVKNRFNLRKEIPVYEHLARQTIPVVINELLVRTFYFVRHLAEEAKQTGDLKSINWEKVIPVDNRTVDRMIAVANMTFSAADTADAVVRSAIESGGNWVLFVGGFAARVNYIGLAKTTVSIVKEITSEQRELQALTEKRILVESRTEKAVELVRKYRSDLERLIDTYLAENLEQYLLGLEQIEAGLESGDSDRLIAGNVTIQRVLGREAQFTNQAEFDALMDSEDDFKL